VACLEEASSPEEEAPSPEEAGDLHPVPTVERYSYSPFPAVVLAVASFLASAVAFPAVAVLAAAFVHRTSGAALPASEVTSAAEPSSVVAAAVVAADYYYPHHSSPRSTNPSASAISARCSSKECPLLPLSRRSKSSPAPNLPSRLRFLPSRRWWWCWHHRSSRPLPRCQKNQPVSAVSECSRRIPYASRLSFLAFLLAVVFFLSQAQRREREREKADQNRRLCFFFSNSPSSSS